METEDAKSEVLNISTGVPQGLILDQLLFIICINDIAKASQKFNFIMYADDTTLKYTRFFSMCEQNGNAEFFINIELNKVSE